VVCISRLENHDSLVAFALLLGGKGYMNLDLNLCYMYMYY
jgi:hypothetical protein